MFASDANMLIDTVMKLIVSDPVIPGNVPNPDSSKIEESETGIKGVGTDVVPLIDVAVIITPLLNTETGIEVVPLIAVAVMVTPLWVTGAGIDVVPGIAVAVIVEPLLLTGVGIVVVPGTAVAVILTSVLAVITG